MAGALALAPGTPARVGSSRAAAAVASRTEPVDWSTVLTRVSRGKTVRDYAANESIFQQGQPADAVYFLIRGKVKLAVASHDGKEAIVATLGRGEFFGEGSLAGQPSRAATAIAVGDCQLTRVDKPTMNQALLDDPQLAAVFIAHLLSRIIRYEADLVDQIFNSGEKRLARVLLLLSHFRPDSVTERVVDGVNQEHLAQMVGTTRSRINLFMNKFRKLGFIDYDAETGLAVHRGLLNVVRRD